MSSKPKKTKAPAATPVQKEPETAQKKVKTHELKLSSEELVHLRDVMSVMLPPDGSTTLSQSLAAAEGRVMVEAKLWTKITDLCKTAGISTDEEAPDFAVGITGVPALGVYALQLHEEDDDEEKA